MHYIMTCLWLFSNFISTKMIGKIIMETLRVCKKYIEIKKLDKPYVKRRVKFEKDLKAYVFAYLTLNLLEQSGLLSTQKVNFQRLRTCLNSMKGLEFE